MSTFEKFDAPGMIEFQTADEGQLLHLTQRGWRLVAIVTDQRIEYANEQIPGPANPNGYTHHVAVQKPIMLTKTRYLMGLSEDTTIKTLREDLDGAVKRAGKAEMDMRTAEESVRKYDGENKILKGTEDRLRKELDARREEVRAADAQKRRMEADIAKIRQAVGELKMKEILAG